MTNAAPHKLTPAQRDFLAWIAAGSICNDVPRRNGWRQTENALEAHGLTERVPSDRHMCGYKYAATVAGLAALNA